MTRVDGTCDDRFKAIEELLQSYFDSGEELGASIVVNVDGENVVDIWGGYADAKRTRPWEKDTITNVWSTTKTVASLAALTLISRGLVSPNEKVSKYWPEFAANGKDDIVVRHILSHSSGVSGWEKVMTIEDICDVPTSTALLAQQAPFWPPGTASGYHSITLGHLIGELVLRTTGKSLQQFIADEITAPLGADFQLGAAEKDWPRVADIIPPPSQAARNPPASPTQRPRSIPEKSMANPLVAAEVAGTAAWRRAELGAVNGHGNARSVARMLSAVSLGGEVDGKRLLTPETVDLIFQEQVRGNDLVVGENLCFGIGYALSGRGTDMNWLPEGRVCLWGGWGGSVIIMDVERRVTIAYVMNKMENVGVGNYRTKAYVKAAYKALGVS
ncbi:Nn.00g096530.m01.CDS01 [Neocucurbitaria sp. VM-36]